MQFALTLDAFGKNPLKGYKRGKNLRLDTLPTLLYLELLGLCTPLHWPNDQTFVVIQYR